MPPSTGTRQRLVGLITVLLVIIAITVVLAFGSSNPKQSEFKVETISGKNSLALPKHFPAVVSTTTTTPVLVEVQRFENALSKYLSTVITVPPRPVIHHVVPTEHVVIPAPTPIVASAGTYNGYPCGGSLPNCCTLRKESGGDPTADNGVGYTGLWQFSHALWGDYHGYQEAKDAPWQLQNEKAAYVVSISGYRPWYGDGCYNGR